MKNIHKATSQGKLYIETKDFFSTEKVKTQIRKGLRLWKNLGK